MGGNVAELQGSKASSVTQGVAGGWLLVLVTETSTERILLMTWMTGWSALCRFMGRKKLLWGRCICYSGCQDAFRGTSTGWRKEWAEKEHHDIQQKQM